MELDYVTTKEIIRDFRCLRTGAKNLLKIEKPYKKLLEYLIFSGIYEKNEYPYITAKELSAILSIPINNLRKQLHQIYADLINLHENNQYFTISKTRYEFFIQGYENCAVIFFDKLTHIPRVGESIDMPHFRAFLNGNFSFYVDSITYYFENDEMITNFILRAGSYNPYLKFRKEEAYAKREISNDDYYEKNDYKLGRILGIKI